MSKAKLPGIIKGFGKALILKLLILSGMAVIRIMKMLKY